MKRFMIIAASALGLVAALFSLDVYSSCVCLFRAVVSVEVKIVDRQTGAALPFATIDVMNAREGYTEDNLPETYKTNADGQATVEFWAETPDGAGIVRRLFGRSALDRALKNIALVISSDGYELQRKLVAAREWDLIDEGYITGQGPPTHVLRATGTLSDIALEASRR